MGIVIFITNLGEKDSDKMQVFKNDDNWVFWAEVIDELREELEEENNGRETVRAVSE